MKLNKRETATVLAALRHWQSALQSGAPWPKTQDFMDIASDGFTIKAMSPKEIDKLAEKINQ
jgi:hypothetical protein